jgi:hypothetical protein
VPLDQATEADQVLDGHRVRVGRLPDRLPQGAARPVRRDRPPLRLVAGDQPLGVQHAEGLADGCAADTETFAELVLGRQLIARGQLPSTIAAAIWSTI